MYPSVAAAFPQFTERFEGHVPFMYLDVKGLVTTGRGNLIDPVQYAEMLPWIHKSDGSPAMQGEIVSEWTAVKAAFNLRLMGGMAYSKITKLCLSGPVIDNLTETKMYEMWQKLLTRFPNLETVPADMQLAVLSLAWACGPFFQFSKFEQALACEDYVTCATEGQMNAQGNPGLVPRNAANMKLCLNASNVVKAHLDPSVLLYT
jgi:GH24 family phage-related lysozyme (muramidase)